MKYVETFQELVPVSSERTFPGGSFPRQYIHCVVNELRDAVHAVLALRAVGCRASEIHVMASWDFVEAVERKRQRQGVMGRLVGYITSFLDEGLGDVYLKAAQQGKHIVYVRLSGGHTVERIKDVLISHNASLLKHVDMWLVTDL